MRGKDALIVSVSKNQAESEITGKNVKIQIHSNFSSSVLVVHIELLGPVYMEGGCPG